MSVRITLYLAVDAEKVETVVSVDSKDYSRVENVHAATPTTADHRKAVDVLTRVLDFSEAVKS